LRGLSLIMKNLIKNERFILTAYLLVFLSTIFILLSFDKVHIHLFVNRNSNETLDFIFRYITILGDGFFVVSFCLLLLLYKYKTAITQALAFSVSGIAVQLLKNLLFTNSLRPNLYFEAFPEHSLRLVEGVKIANYYSFPSGHTASAFAMFFVFIFLVKKRWLKIVFLTIAMLVGYSRMYLSQHFMIDITIGSLIGVMSAIIIYSFMSRYNNKKLESSLIKQFFRLK